MRATTSDLPRVEKLQVQRDKASADALQALQAEDQVAFIRNQKRANVLDRKIAALLNG
jgi:hypothetical protein